MVKGSDIIWYSVDIKVPTAHPALVDYDEEAWELICQEGLAGFTGIPDDRNEERYESVGGHEVGNMVRGLWPEEYYECIWVRFNGLLLLLLIYLQFVNPPVCRGPSHRDLT